jgi:hypothetical protein
MSTEELQAIARNYNHNFVEKNPLAKAKKIKIVNDKEKLVKELKKELSTKCGTADHCWVQQDFVDQSTQNMILKKAFRPVKPLEWYKDRNTWLNTYDILNVMKQYEAKYKDFFFLGVFPIDFKEKDEYGYCVAPGMCEFSMKKILEKGKRRFAMILNLDRHDQSGSHWVALYCNMYPKRKNFGIYYYDSVGYSPSKEVATFMQDMEKQAHEVFSARLAKRFAMRYNKIQKQFEDTECGVFSEVFLTQILKDVPFDEIIRKMKKDHEINRLRDVLYTPSMRGEKPKSGGCCASV